jgi:hypothetical protein
MTPHLRVELNLCFIRVFRATMWWALVFAAIPQIVRQLVPTTGWGQGIAAAGASNVATYLSLGYAGLFAVALPIACCYETRRRISTMALPGRPGRESSRAIGWAISGWSVLMFIASLCVASVLFIVWAVAFNELLPMLRPSGVETTTRRTLELALANRALIEPMFLATVFLCIIRAAWIQPDLSNAIPARQYWPTFAMDPLRQIALYSAALALTLLLVGAAAFGWLGRAPRYALRLLPMGDVAAQEVQPDMPVYYRGQYVGTVARGSSRDSLAVQADAEKLRGIRLLEAVAIVRQPQFGLGGPFLEITVDRLADDVRADLSMLEDGQTYIQMPCLAAIDASGISQTLGTVQSFLEDAKVSVKSVDAATTQATVFMRQSGRAIDAFVAILDDYNSGNPKLPVTIAIQNLEKRMRYVTDAIWPVIADELDYVKRATAAFSHGTITIDWGKGSTTKPAKQ